MKDGLYVQYGCGWDAPDGWLNFDASPTLRVERIAVIGKTLSSLLKRNATPFPDNVRYGDIVKGLPVKDSSCIAVYCSHVLEHLSLDDFRRALINTKKLLRSGGIFRLVVPDLDYFITEYQNDRSAEAAPQFMRGSGLGEISRPRGLKSLVSESWGNSRHRWMWDYPSLENELLSQGFKKVRRARFGDSRDPAFLQVERPGRWNNCLGIECEA